MTTLDLQLRAMQPTLGNPQRMAQTLLLQTSPHADATERTDAVAAALILKRALTEPNAYSAVQGSLAEGPSDLARSISTNLSALKESLHADRKTSAAFQRAFAPLEKSLASNRSFAGIEAALNSFFSGSGVHSDEVDARPVLAGQDGFQSRNRKVRAGLTKYRPTIAFEGSPSPGDAYDSARESIWIVSGDEIFAEKNIQILQRAKERGVKDIRILLAAWDSPFAIAPRLGAPEARRPGMLRLLNAGFDVRLIPFYSGSSAIIDGKRMISESQNNLALALGAPDAIKVWVDDDHVFLSRHIEHFEFMHQRASHARLIPTVPLLPPPRAVPD